MPKLSSFSMSVVFAGVGGVTLIACSKTPAPNAFASPSAHVGDAWFAYRAQGLGITEAAARERDITLSAETPPHDAWDEQLASESAALWAQLCASCHGPRGRLEGVPANQPQPRAWGGMGAAMGFFFGGDAMRAGIYRKITEGVQTPEGEPTTMAPFKNVLSNEQRWGLVFFIETL